MYPHHVFDLEPAGTFGMYPIYYQRVSGRYFQPEPAMYSRCFCWFPSPLAPSASNFMVITYRTHLKCTHNMYSIWDWWEHFCDIWIVSSTCASYVTTHNSWQSFEICPMIFSKCSSYMLSGNILITWLILRNT